MTHPETEEGDGWDMEGPAVALCERLGDPATFPHEILKLENETAAIIVDLGGVDYILTMQRAPKQRPRPH